MRTVDWDAPLRVNDAYKQLEEESVTEAAKAQVEHVTQMTGESEATMDPTLSPSLNRVV